MTESATGRDSAAQLRAKASRGVVALALKTFGKHGLGVIRLAVVARLLGPADFGLFAIATALLRGLEVVASLGPDQYLIQRKTVDPAFLGTAWVLRAALGVGICLLAVLAAPVYAAAAKQPEAAAVVAIVALRSFVRGFRSTGTLLAEREVRFGRLAVFEVTVSLVETVVVIALALWLRDVSALAWGLVATAAAEVALSYLLFRAPFRPSFHREVVRDVLSAGKHFFVISLGSFVMVQADNLIVGVLLGPTLLGFYVVAYRLCDVPIALTFQVTNRVALPVFSRVQDDPVRKREGFVVMADLQNAVLIPVTVCTVTLADVFVPALYGDGWEPAVSVTRALALVMLGRGFAHIVAPFLVANNHFAFASRSKVLEVVAFIVGVTVGASIFGNDGAALGAGLGYVVTAIQRAFYIFAREQIHPRDIVGPVLAALGCSLPAAAVAAACARVIPLPPVVVALLCLVVFGAVYASLTFALRPRARKRVLDALGALRGRPASKRVMPATSSQFPGGAS